MKTFTKLLFFLSLLTAVAATAADWSAKTSPHGSRTPYKTVSMNFGYAERDQSRHVTYMTPEERERYRIVIQDGLVYTSEGKPVPDSADGPPDRPNNENYVMDSNGNFYLFNEELHPEIRHSSIFAGGKVAGGGEITVKKGHVILITARSGHYPTVPLLPNVVTELQADGVEAKSLGVRDR